VNIWETLEAAVREVPDKVGVVDGARRLTYREVWRRVGAVVRFLQDSGLRPGDRISILALNSLPFFETHFAAAAAGAILNPLNVRLSASELERIMAHAGASWLVGDGDLLSRLEPAALERLGLKGMILLGKRPRGWSPPVPVYPYEETATSHAGPAALALAGPDDTAHLYYTSGTTGEPKGVMLTHRNVVAHARAAVEELSITGADVWGHIAPLFHLADAWATFAISLAGGTHVMQPRFDAEATLALIQQERLTLSNLIPTMLNLMIKHPSFPDYDYSSLRVILSGGAPIAPEVVRQILERFGCDYVQTYGMTETSPYLTLSLLTDDLRREPPEVQLRYKAMTGRPFKTVELRVVDEAGADLPRDGQRVGEIWARGETVTPGYWRNPEETRAAFCDGWLRTGDLAVIDERGYLNIVDRKKDTILTGGENVYSTEVEAALYRNSAILEAAVFGIPHPVWGEIVAAAVVLKPDGAASAEEIVEFCRGELSSFKVPRRIELLEELPRTGSGKIFKKALRERFGAVS
jgi:acyl-CoA synthetase (AMP-forming)/AMP-acid ligase II